MKVLLGFIAGIIFSLIIAASEEVSVITTEFTCTQTDFISGKPLRREVCFKYEREVK